jgi:hypothetical protein
MTTGIFGNIKFVKEINIYKQIYLLVWIYSRSPVGNSKGSNKGLYHKC